MNVIDTGEKYSCYGFLTDVIMEAVELVHPDRSHPPVVAAHGGFVVWVREGVGDLLLVDMTHLGLNSN